MALSTWDLYQDIYTEFNALGLVGSDANNPKIEYKKYWMDYHLGNEVIDEGIKIPSYLAPSRSYFKDDGGGYEGLIFYHYFNGGSWSKYPPFVEGTPNKDIYVAAQDVTFLEQLPEDKKQYYKDNLSDVYIKIVSLTPEDIVLLPFESNIQIYFDDAENILYKLTESGSVDRLVQYLDTDDQSTIRNSIAFLDTLSGDVITEFYSGALAEHKTGRNPGRDQDPLTGDGRFVLRKPESFSLKAAQVIKGFDPRKDVIFVDGASFGKDDLKIKFAKTGKKLAKLQRKPVDLIVDKQSSSIFYNENGAMPGLGEGGLLAVFSGSPRLGQDNFVGL